MQLVPGIKAHELDDCGCGFKSGCGFSTHTHTHARGEPQNPALEGFPFFLQFFFCVQTSAKVMKTRIKNCRARDNEENEFSFSCIDTEICNRTTNPNRERKKSWEKVK